MKKLVGLLASVVIAASCAAPQTASAQAPPAAPSNFAQQPPATATNVYRGEVWTWDEREGWVTLRQGDKDVRVKVSPDQFVGLQLHQITTLRGQLAPPSELVTVVPTGPVAFVPTGPEGETIAVSGQVTAVDPNGKITVQTDRGPVEVWIAAGSPYKAGDTVNISSAVRSVQVVSAASAPAATQPSAAVATEPGDHAVVTGRIVTRDANGRLAVESPRGLIQVWVRPADAERFRVGDFVQVRTRVRQGS